MSPKLVRLYNGYEGMENFIEINDLVFARGERTIFSKINLTIPRGKIVAIMGPSGSGKTTLLKLIGATIYPDQGQIKVAGENIHALKPSELYRLRKSIGMLFQSGALFTGLDVFENVAFPLREHTKLSEQIIRDIVLMQLETVGLRGASQLMPSELSGGMARRVALARALVLNPHLIMYDEPFTGQDPITLGVLVRLIRHLNDALGLTSIVVSHDVQETLSIADYVYVIAGGKVVGEGTPSAIAREGSPLVKQFINGLADGPVPFHYPALKYQEELGL